MKDNVKARIGKLGAEDIASLCAGDISSAECSASNDRIKKRLLEKANIKKTHGGTNLMKKLSKLQKTLAFAACFCLIVGAAFGIMGAAGVFDAKAPINPNQGIMSPNVGLRMLKSGIQNDAEGTTYKYYVVLDVNYDADAVAESFISVGADAKVIEFEGEKYIELNATREQLLAYEAPDDMLLFFAKTLTNSGDDGRRY